MIVEVGSGREFHTLVVGGPWSGIEFLLSDGSTTIIYWGPTDSEYLPENAKHTPVGVFVGESNRDTLNELDYDSQFALSIVSAIDDYIELGNSASTSEFTWRPIKPLVQILEKIRSEREEKKE